MRFNTFPSGIDGAIAGVGAAFLGLLLLEIFIWSWIDPAHTKGCLAWLVICLVITVIVFVIFGAA